jgi:hypothetical protein
MVCLLGSLDHGYMCDGDHSRPQQNMALGPKIPIVNTAFMDLGARTALQLVASSNAARYHNGNAHQTTDETLLIAADSVL